MLAKDHAGTQGCLRQEAILSLFVDTDQFRLCETNKKHRERAGRDGRFAHERTEILAGIMSESHKKRLSSRRACPDMILFRVIP